ncbi:5536_t:CDS:2 [Entrophospora sp. SA101]|nr:5536_t:CDS:2 [Entrophospora sp. SA101]CAJ0832733.1 16866_t:CDS:2 [Entrophospora sp. SA101]
MYSNNCLIGLEHDELEENPQTKITTPPLSELLVNIEENKIDLIDLLEKYCKKPTTKKYNLAHSYILDLSNTLSISLSNIKQEFNQQAWQDLLKDKPKFFRNINYYREIDTILDHLFGSKDNKDTINLEEACKRWINLRSLSLPVYNSNFSYEKSDWNRVIFWVERATGLDAFEAEANPILQTNCGEREWSGEYIYPIFKGAFTLNRFCRVPWGEVTSKTSQERKNSSVNVMEQQVKRGHQMDILCIAGTYEVFCGYVCGSASYTDLTKLSNDEFDLIRGLKDMLSHMINKFDSEQNLYTLGFEVNMSFKANSVNCWLT